MATAVATKKPKLRARDRVLNVITKFGPLTDEQMQRRLSMNGSTQRTRRFELMEAGLVVQDAKNGRSKAGRSVPRYRLK